MIAILMFYKLTANIINQLNCRTAAIAAAAATVEALEGPSHPPVDNAANTATKMFGKGLHDVDPRELYRGCTEKSRGGGYTNLQSGRLLFWVFALSTRNIIEVLLIFCWYKIFCSIASSTSTKR